MDIEKEIESNINQQKELVCQLKETKMKCIESPHDKILLFRFSMLMHQYDLYNEAIRELQKELDVMMRK